MKYTITLFLSIISGFLAAQSPFIHVDQYGYMTDAVKVAVLSNPQSGNNSNLSYTPAASIDLHDLSNNTIVASYTPVVWNSGNVHSNWSGDSGWWLDFSSMTTSGTYVLVDPVSQDSSAIFEISSSSYDQALKASVKMFYYNRCGMSKVTPFAEPKWVDASNNFDHALQDVECRYIYDQNNSSLEKDLSGGWFDAGDYNKYVTFTMTTIHNLLWAYQENPSVFTDNFNIPESNNGIPDIIDEIKWELDWLLKMNNADGSTHIKMGSSNYNDNSTYPPSNNFDQRYYGPTCTSASLTIASVFAHAAKIMQGIPALSSYGANLETKAIAAWNYVLPYYNSGTLEMNCDDGSIVAGDADFNAETYQESMIAAAIYLFDLTGDQSYNTFISNNYLNSLVFGANPNNPNDPSTYYDDWWDINHIHTKDAFLHYGNITGHNTQVASDFMDSFEAMVTNDWESLYGLTDNDLYRAYLPTYFLGWGSNMSEGNMGILNFLVKKYDPLNGNTDTYLEKAGGHLHYLHGVNPLNISYLSNMYGKGGDQCADEIYHTWFQDGSVYDNAITSSNGPAPGFLSGGANHTYSGSLTPPSGEPYLKAYANFNDTGNVSWEVTEPAIYYQAAYIRLLSQIMSLSTTTPPPPPTYTPFGEDDNWKPMKTGAGGWLTGLDIHPSGSPIYTRSDVGGAYRYNSNDNNWTQIVVASSMPSSDVDWSKYGGVLSVVSAPSDANRAYMAYQDGVFFSDNQGDQWIKTGLPSIDMYANADYSKLSGERLSVDPNNKDVVYMGTINNGLWKTDNGGTTWTYESDLENGAIDFGVRSIHFDESSNVINNKTQTIYTVIDSVGVFRSINGGDDWTDITPTSLLPSGEPLFLDVEINSSGELFIVGETWDDKNNTNPGDDDYNPYGLLVYRNGQWQSLYSGSITMGEIALDPFNSQRAFIFSNGFTDTYRTNNLGNNNPNWTLIGYERQADSIPYLAWTEGDWFSLGEIEFDPQVSNKIWIADGLGSWISTDLNDSVMTWEEESAGQEHLVSNDLAVLPDGKTVSFHWDRPVFRHDDIDEYPTVHQPTSRFNSAWSVDQFPSDPDYLVGIIEDHRYCCYDNETRTSGYSTDGGQSWTQFASMPDPSNGFQIFGEIAVSANDKDNIVWLPADDIMPYYTTDRGNTWTQVTLPNNSGICCISANFLKRRALTADRVLDNTFYIYDWGDGSIFKSTNGGVSWTKNANVVSDFSYNGKLLSVPTQAGHLLFANGPEQSAALIEGLAISEDEGSTWTIMSNTDKVINYAVGKAAPNGTYPTIFIQGEVDGVYGFWRSEDKGVNWTQIGLHPSGIYDWASVMVGDMNNHERLYIGFPGNGFLYYGDLEDQTTSDTHVEVSDIDIQVFPCPVDQFFTIKGELSYYNIDILNSMGQLVQVVPNTGNEITIDVSTLGSGLYFLRLVHQNNKNLYLRTIIKE